MEHNEYTQDRITKSMLKSLHDKQLMNGESNKLYKEEIISTLGGIDEILSKLLESNLNFNQKQLQTVYNIITHTYSNKQTTSINKTSNNLEDKKRYEKRLEFTFNENDILLYKIFKKQTAKNIINILNHKITKIGLAMIAFICAVLVVVSFKSDVYFYYGSFFLLTFAIYFFAWILYCNTEAMKLLLKEFEFWFKLLYLIVYLITISVIHYVNDRPFIFICAVLLFTGTILFLAMIFDAISIKQSNKIIISSCAVGTFSFTALNWSQQAFYRNEYNIYDQLTVTIPDLFGVSSMIFNIMDISINACQILVIFLFKQLISSVIKPEQALVIKNKPFIIYENTKENIPTIKTVKNWKLITVVYSVVVLLVFLALVLTWKHNIISTILYSICTFAQFILICLFLCGKIKYLWTGNILIIVLLVVYVIGIFLLKWSAIFIAGIQLQFGISVTYSYKVSKFKQFEIESNMSTLSNENVKVKERENDIIKNKNDEQMHERGNDNIIKSNVNEIEIATVKSRVNKSNYKMNMRDQRERSDSIKSDDLSDLNDSNCVESDDLSEK